VLQGESDYKEPSIEGLSSALEENESQKLVFENRLGCDLYLRKFKDNFEQVELVHKDQSNLVHLPPPRFPDRFINVSDARPPRHFVAIHVSEAKVRETHGMYFEILQGILLFIWTDQCFWQKE
jgi:vacuolar protein sorting-associated protein 13A/C